MGGRQGVGGTLTLQVDGDDAGDGTERNSRPVSGHLTLEIDSR